MIMSLDTLRRLTVTRISQINCQRTHVVEHFRIMI